MILFDGTTPESIAPVDHGEQWKPCVTDHRHSLLSQLLYRGHLCFQPPGTHLLGSECAGLRAHDRALIATIKILYQRREPCTILLDIAIGQPAFLIDKNL